MKNIRFSVIIPIYNVEKYLERCINSVLEQNYRRMEIILVNDGSTDNSLKICERYKKAFSEIVLINQKNQGQATARNIGIKASQGEYIIFLDSDDCLEKDKLKEIDAVLEKNLVDILGVRWKHYDLEGNFLGVYTINERIKKEQIFNGYEYIKKWGSAPPMVWQYIYRKEFIEKNSLYFVEGVFFEDCEYMTRVYLSAKNIYNSRIVFYNYCYSPNSTMKRKNIKKCEDLIKVSGIINNIADKYEKKVKRHLRQYASYLAWESVHSCVGQGYDLKKFLSSGGNREKIVANISGVNKYIIIKILLLLHLDNIFSMIK